MPGTSKTFYKILCKKGNENEEGNNENNGKPCSSKVLELLLFWWSSPRILNLQGTNQQGQEKQEAAFCALAACFHGSVAKHSSLPSESRAGSKP